jgi:hypothetical protein
MAFTKHWYQIGAVNLPTKIWPLSKNNFKWGKINAVIHTWIHRKCYWM